MLDEVSRCSFYLHVSKHQFGGGRNKASTKSSSNEKTKSNKGNGKKSGNNKSNNAGSSDKSSKKTKTSSGSDGRKGSGSKANEAEPQTVEREKSSGHRSVSSKDFDDEERIEL